MPGGCALSTDQVRYRRPGDPAVEWYGAARGTTPLARGGQIPRALRTFVRLPEIQAFAETVLVPTQLVLAMFGKWRFPGQARLAQAKCPKCLRYRIGKGPCACEKRK